MEKSDNLGIDNNENNDINISSNNDGNNNGNNEIIPVNYDISEYNPRAFNNSNQIGFCGTFTNIDPVQQMQNQINQMQLSQMQYQMNNMQQQLYNKNNRSDKMEMENLTENIAKSIINSKKESMNLKENRDLNFTTIQSNNNQLNNIPMIDRNLLYENNNNNSNNNYFLQKFPNNERDYIDISNALDHDINSIDLFFPPNAYTNIRNEIANSYDPYQYFESYMKDRGDKPNILYKFIRDLKNCNMFNCNYLNSNLINVINSIDRGVENENIYELIAILSIQFRDYKKAHINNIKTEDVIKLFNNYTLQYFEYLKIKGDLENNVMANDYILNSMKKVVKEFFQKSPIIYQSINNLEFISNAITSNTKINNLLIERVNDIIMNINGLMANTNLNLDHINDLERRISALVRDINLNQNNNNKNFTDIINAYDSINKDIANLQIISNITSRENIDTKKIKEAIDYLGNCLSKFDEFKAYKAQDIRNNSLILINDLLNDLLNENAQISDNEKEVKDKIKKIIDNLNTLSKDYVNYYYKEILSNTLKTLKDGIESSKKESLESITSINDKLNKLDKFNEIFKEESDGIKDDITKLKKENEDLKKTNECIIELIKDNIPNVKDKLEKRLQEIREDKLEKRRHEIREENTRKRMERLERNRNEIISKDDNNPPLDFNSDKPDSDINDVYKNSSNTESNESGIVGIVIDENTIEAVKDDSHSISNDSLDSIIEKIDKINKEEVAYKEFNGNNVDILRVRDFWEQIYDLYESHSVIIISNDKVNNHFRILFENFIAILKSYNGEYYKELREKYQNDCSIETFNKELNLNLFK